MYITGRVVCTTDKVNVYNRQMAFNLALGGILDLHDDGTPVEDKNGVYSTYLYAEVWNKNRFLFLFFFRLAISPT